MNLRQRTSKYSYNDNPDHVAELVKLDLSEAAADLHYALDAAKQLSDIFANDGKAPDVLALTEVRELAQRVLDRTNEIIQELE